MQRLAETADPAVRQARAEMEANDIPVAEYHAWRAQRYRAEGRGIPFRFTLLMWSTWWRPASRAPHCSVRPCL